MLLLSEKPKVWRHNILQGTILIGKAQNANGIFSGRWVPLFETVDWPPIDQVVGSA